jgi:Cys-tRNA(Pro)/Cys-tRNA(Cys) deacylase
MRKQARTTGGATPAVMAMRAAGIAFTEHHYDSDGHAGSFGLEAAQALGLSPDEVFKTLLVTAGRAGDLVVAVVPVQGSLDLKALASATGNKSAAMADPAVAERSTGYVRGGISPLGQRRRLPTVVDESALLLSTMYVSGGRRGFDIGVDPVDLVRLTGAVTAAIAAP